MPGAITLISDVSGRLGTVTVDADPMYAGSNTYHTQWRFGPVNSAGGTVSAATLTFVVDAAQDVTLRMHIEDVADAAVLTGRNAEGWARVAGNNVNGDPGTGSEAVDVTALVQSAFDRTDWGSGGDMAFALMAGAAYADGSDAQYLNISAGDATLSITLAAGGANPKGPLGHPLRGPFAGPIS